MNQEHSRRKFIKEVIYFTSASLGTGLILNACNQKTSSNKEDEEKNSSKDPCVDFSEVSQEELEKRKKFGYVKQSPIPDRHCGNCNLHIPPSQGKVCGGCMLFKGPVYSTGYCTYWAPQQT